MVDMRHAMKDCEDIVQIANKVTIFDGIINTKDAWEKLPTETIVKCFPKAGIYEDMFDDVDPIDNDCDKQTTNTGDAFDHWFAYLLEVPWDEYLAYDDDMEAMDPPPPVHQTLLHINIQMPLNVKNVKLKW